MTELRWEGKYLNDRKVAPVKLALPFQTIETVNESVEQRMSLFSAPAAQTEWRNRLIWGDKKYVLPSLLTEFAGKVNLIYIDPPFDTGANFSFTTTIPNAPAEADPDGEETEGGSFVKQPSVIEQKAYRDTWGRGLDSYLQWFYETALLLRELLADDGSIYVHLDWHVGHYAKIVLDEVFGYENFVNEVVWHYKRWPAQSKNFQKMHDVILLYGKSSRRTFHTSLQELTEGTNKRWQGMKSKVEFVDGVRQVTQMTEEQSKGTPQDDVWNVPVVNSQATERVNYATQKPEALLERVIKASSNAGDLVLDCFCGSGTTAAVAEKLGRRWITCDLGRFAIHTARKRLLGIGSVKPFVVQNLGKYERQQWMMAELQPDLNAPGLSVAQAAPTLLEQRLIREESYRKFILDLYRATSLKGGYTWLHGAKSGRLVHVGGVDAPVALGDVQNILKEFWKIGGRPSDGKTGASHTNGIDILGWEFAFDINETASQMAAANNVSLRLIKIPREVLEKKAVEQGDIRFFELAFVNVSVKQDKRKLDLALTDFVMPPDDVPQEIQANISHWSQWVDYWAVDWDFKNDTFHNQWQSYRTRQNTKLTLATEHHYAAPGTYQVVVKVIDILGNDTTKTLTITV